MWNPLFCRFVIRVKMCASDWRRQQLMLQLWLWTKQQHIEYELEVFFRYKVCHSKVYWHQQRSAVAQLWQLAEDRPPNRSVLQTDLQTYPCSSSYMLVKLAAWDNVPSKRADSAAAAALQFLDSLKHVADLFNAPLEPRLFFHLHLYRSHLNFLALMR